MSIRQGVSPISYLNTLLMSLLSSVSSISFRQFLGVTVSETDEPCNHWMLLDTKS